MFRKKILNLFITLLIPTLLIPFYAYTKNVDSLQNQEWVDDSPDYETDFIEPLLIKRVITFKAKLNFNLPDPPNQGSGWTLEVTPIIFNVTNLSYTRGTSQTFLPNANLKGDHTFTVDENISSLSAIRFIAEIKVTGIMPTTTAQILNVIYDEGFLQQNLEFYPFGWHRSANLRDPGTALIYTRINLGVI